MYSYDTISLNQTYNEKYFKQSCRENQNTHFMSSNFFRVVLSDNVEIHVTAGQATDDNIIRAMRFACWITKVTNTNSDYIILVAFPR
jgi:hypothetical protein